MKTFDFESAKIKHTLWSSRLRSFIYGDMHFEAELQKGEHDCELGKWIDKYENHLAKSNAFLELRDVHEKIHQYTQDIIALRKENADLLVVAESYKAYETQMKVLLGLLDKMKIEITTKY